MKKRGFTLIELLAVIIILAIIALIATPIIMRLIENSKKAAAEVSAKNYIHAIETKAVAQMMKDTTLDGIYSINENGNLCPGASTDCSEQEEIKIEMNGTKPSSGRVKITNEKVIAYQLTIGEYENTYGSFSRLPVGYQEVEYIQNQSSDTNLSYLIINLSNMDIKKAIFEYGFYYKGNWQPMLFSLAGNNSDYGNYICLAGRTNGNIAITPIAQASGGVFNYDITSWEITNIPQATYMRTSWSDKEWTPIGKFKNIKLYDSLDNLKIDLVPCYRTEDETPGMYDIINHVFYTNQGTGTFEVGPEV